MAPNLGEFSETQSPAVPQGCSKRCLLVVYILLKNVFLYNYCTALLASLGEKCSAINS